MIELPDVCIEQYEIESTLMAKYMRWHHLDLMRKFGRGASLGYLENPRPLPDITMTPTLFKTSLLSLLPTAAGPRGHHSDVCATTAGQDAPWVSP